MEGELKSESRLHVRLTRGEISKGHEKEEKH